MRGSAPDFEEAVGVLRRALKFGINPSLDGIRALTDELGRPQDAYAVVQVTGTNGKSSVTRMCAALLAAEGLEAAAYTSPHLESYTERIEIGGVACGDEEFAAAIGAAEDAARSLGRGADAFTEFELLTAAALWFLRERGVDVACLEVGMGGRWDATSVAHPVVAVVTGVGLDHTERLGSTIQAIAFDKSHIIVPGASVVLGPGTLPVVDVFLERAAGLGLSPRFVAEAGGLSSVEDERTVRYAVTARPDRPGGALVLDVYGVHRAYATLELPAPSYQAPNVAVAIAAAECAVGRELREEAARSALAGMVFPGRFELVASDPPVVLDGAHNPQAAEALAGAIAEAWPDPAARPLALIGVLADKDAEGIVRALAPVVSGFVATQPDSSRALGADGLASLIERVAGVACPVTNMERVSPEWVDANALPGGLVVTGSLYAVGGVRGRLSATGHRARGHP